jgi:YD repeat-containing protein
MRLGGQWARVGAICCTVGALAWLALAASSGGTTGSGLPSGSLQSASLDLRGAPAELAGGSGAQSAAEAQRQGAAAQARRYSPAAIAARLRSRSAFEHLGSVRAVRVAREAFPEVIDRPAGGPPPLPVGGRVVGYSSATVAQLALPGGKHAVVQSLAPMAIETSPGHRLPVDLGLTKAGNVYESVRPVAGVLIPRHAGEGVQLPESGVSLTPVDAQGIALGGSEGAVDGTSVVYANTQADTDTVVKPTTEGVEADTMLRSVDSPGQLYFRVGLPAGASLVGSHGAGGSVRVVEDGQTVAVVRPPSAMDAAGTTVPVSMGVKGDLLALTVSANDNEYQYPIAVDPELAEVPDSFIGPSECYKTGEAERISSNWCVHESPAEGFSVYWASGAVELTDVSAFTAGNYGVVAYHTQGESKIYRVEAESGGSVEKGVAKLELARNRGEEKGEVEKEYKFAEKTTWRAGASLCATSNCLTSGGTSGNIAAFKLEQLETSGSHQGVSGGLWSTHVYITQEKAPGVTFNESESEIDEVEGKKRVNVLQGGGGWLSPSSGAFEVKAHDPGIGVSWAQVVVGGFRQEEPIFEGGKCNGVQCNENYAVTVTYNPKMPDGSDSIEGDASDLAGSKIVNGKESVRGLLGKEFHSLKVDGTAPYNLEVTGWPARREISAAPHTLTIEATDGTSPTPSSGVQSVGVQVDGGAIGYVPNASCAEGPCTASGKYTLDAEGLSEGVHRLTITATDNAGNVGAREWTFDVRHGSPVPVGPGTVDPTTGQFKLSATDVSLAGSGGVSRVYESRNLTAGAGGPLGPQWALALGGGEGLTVLPTGSVVLTSSAGATTTFTRNKEGEFESPLGDGNVKIEAKEKVPGKGITEYLLKDTTAGTTTTFEQPKGTENTVPLYANQFGVEGVQMNRPSGAAIDSSGNVWVADYLNNRILKFSRAGTLLAAYGSYGSPQGNFVDPREIAINQSNGDVYVVDEGNHRIVELNPSGEFVETFGWGVNLPGKPEFEICNTYCKAGVAGSGEGQFSEPKALTVDSSGDVWVADAGSNRIDEFTEKGEYVKKIGTEGSGTGQLKKPMGIAFYGGNMYVSEFGNDRVQELSPAGKYEGQFGKEGSGKSGSGASAEFKEPRGIAVESGTGYLYVVDAGNNRIQEFSSAGNLIAKFGSAGSGAGQLSEAKGVAVSSFGGVYVADYNNNRMEEWTRPTWLPTISESPLPSTKISYAYKAVEVEEKTVIEPTEAVAPSPAEVTCVKANETKVGEELKKGCRGLLFTYATKTKSAIGEGPSEWGEYTGHLQSVSFKAYNPAKSAEKMEEKVVAEYVYDSKGRLRAEWDPRISPALKTTYGYDAEGHVTAVNPAGQEPWLMHYGATTGDPSTGRLLSVTRPAAASKTVLKEQEANPAPVNTAIPTLSSTSPTVGTTLKVFGNGSWSNGPLAYSYLWEDCNSAGGECMAIRGAVNQSYTPQASDAGYKLVAQVSAENASGATVASTSASAAVQTSAPSFSSASGFGVTNGEAKYETCTSSCRAGIAGSGEGQFKEPFGVAVDSEGNVWTTDRGNNRVEKFSSSGSFVGAYSPDSMLEPLGVAVNPTSGKVYVSNSYRNRIDELSSSGSLVKVFGEAGQFNVVSGITVDPYGNVWATDWGNGRVDEFSSSGLLLKRFGKEGASTGEFKNPAGVAACGGHLYVVDQGNNRVQKLSLEGQYEAAFGSSGAGNGQFNAPSRIACEPVGNDLYVTDKGNNRVQEFNLAGSFLAVFGSAGQGSGQMSSPVGVAVGPTGSVYVADSVNNRLEKWTPTYSTNNPLPAPPALGANAVTTIEYGVPLSGTGLPNLTSSEVAKWGQKDDPTPGAMAIFPPVKPMGWPAKEYERASFDYMDEEGRTVNTASPSGGIATTEYNEKYNEINQVKRTLSAGNRATALKESTEAAQIKAAESLDSKNTYNEKGQLAETLGPEHEVKVAKGNGKGITGGSEVEARNHLKYFYDEGSPEGRTYNLVTKTEDAAQTASKEEFDPRETKTSYSGQENLGWTLRKPTSTTTDPGGLNLTSETLYEKTTGNVIEARSAKGAGSGSHAAPVFAWQLGAEGTGEGQFRKPMSEAFDSSGNLWTVDSGNDRVQVFSAQGVLLKKFGSEGAGAGQFKSPWGIAISKSTEGASNVYVSDVTNDRVEEFSPSGAFVRAFGFGVSNGEEKFEICTSGCLAGRVGSGNGQFHSPRGIAVDPNGHVWVVDEGNSRVEEFKENGEYIGQFGSHGAENGQLHEPAGIAVSDGNLYVAEYANNRVQEFTTGGVYVNKFGSKGTGNGQFEGAEGIAADPVSGDLYVTDFGNGRVQEFTTGGAFLTSFGAKGSGAGQFKGPEGVAVNGAGTIYVADTENGRVQVWEPIPSAPVYASQFGSSGNGSGQFSHPMMDAVDSSGNLWVVDAYNNRVEKFSSAGTFLAAYGEAGSSETKVQFEEPVGIAINQKTGNVYVGDQNNNRVVEMSSSGALLRVFGKKGTGHGEFQEADGVAIGAKGYVYVTDYKNDRVEVFNEEGGYVSEFGTKGSEKGQLNGPADIAIAGEQTIYVTDEGNSRVDEFSEEGKKALGSIGSNGGGNGQFKYPTGITTDAIGNVYVADDGNARVQEFTASGTYLTQFGLRGSGNGQMAEPEGVALTSTGTMYVTDAGSNNRVQEWTPAWRSGNEGAHDTRTAYYSSAEESTVAACRKHPEWANLPCQTEPAAQPGANESPELPVVTLTYNMWDEVETTLERFDPEAEATATRTKAQTYDAAGRALTSEETSSPVIDTALPKVTNTYNEETGALETQSATINSKTKTITSVLNTLGELQKYTDAEGNTSTYVYNLDGQVEEVNDGQSENKGVQTYAYEAKTGYLEKLVDSSAGTFIATYDVEGKMLTESYPNAMTAKYAYNPTGASTVIEYKKEKHCAGTCPETWFNDTVVPSVHGETLAQASTLSKEGYVYDNVGRLAETQETPAGKGCKSRLYGYDEEGSRTSQTTRESSTETCASEGGLLQTHTYDSANRLIDAGMSYDTFGNVVTLPEVDAGGQTLTSGYYVDNQVVSQTQNGTTNEYVYDPAGRTMETKSEVKATKAKSTTVPHYSGPGEALTWTSEEGGKWSRNIPGVDGALDAIEKSGEETKPALQLHDLQGNIVGTPALSETETKLLSTYNSTEFGVPSEGKAPPKYAWLGAGGVTSETSFGTGTTVTQGGASYVPQIARSLQTALVVPPGAFPNGSGTGSQYGSEIPGWYISLLSEESANTLAEYTAKVEAERRQKEKEAIKNSERMARERGEIEALNASQGGVEEEEGLVVIGEYAQPESDSGGPIASASSPCKSHDTNGSGSCPGPHNCAFYDQPPKNLFNCKNHATAKEKKEFEKEHKKGQSFRGWLIELLTTDGPHGKEPANEPLEEHGGAVETPEQQKRYEPEPE